MPVENCRCKVGAAGLLTRPVGVQQPERRHVGHQHLRPARDPRPLGSQIRPRDLECLISYDVNININKAKRTNGGFQSF